MPTKTITARLPQAVAADLDLIASYDDVAVSEIVREAIANLIDSRFADPAFKDRVLQSAERTRQILERFGEAEAAQNYDFRGAEASTRQLAQESALLR